MNANTILRYLETLANNNLTVNLFMHLIVLTALVSIFLVKNGLLKRYLFQASISTLFISVTIHALVFGNIFHAITIGILSVVALVQLFFNKKDIEASNSSLRTDIALGFIFTGFWYPEFVSKSMLQLLIFSPVGVLPCPTLLATIGLMTLAYPATGKVQYAMVIFMGFVYGVIGTFVLKVYVDAALLALAIFAVCTFFTTSNLGKRVTRDQPFKTPVVE